MSTQERSEQVGTLILYSLYEDSGYNLKLGLNIGLEMSFRILI